MAGRPQKPVPADTPAARAELIYALRQLLGSHPLSLERVAQLSGLGKSTLSHALSGHRLPTRETVERLVETVELNPEARQKFMDLWHRAAVAEGRVVAPPPPPSHPVGAPNTDLTVVQDGKVWVFEAKQTPTGTPGAQNIRLLRSLVSDPERMAAFIEMAQAQSALDEAMDRLEEATADVAEARAALHAATSRVRGSMPADEEGGRRDPNAAVRIADDIRPDQ
ncbi:helix-turn-helix domain-containing protein [Streptomyces sp. NPDC090021]|uniref:helix-turn-helix domain-containing protein n=1 Tax=Streptomyces sp. NPDC090021 TaxID=3365919 RepID=UPI003818EE2F